MPPSWKRTHETKPGIFFFFSVSVQKVLTFHDPRQGQKSSSFFPLAGKDFIISFSLCIIHLAIAKQSLFAGIVCQMTTRRPLSPLICLPIFFFFVHASFVGETEGHGVTFFFRRRAPKAAANNIDRVMGAHVPP